MHYDKCSKYLNQVNRQYGKTQPTLTPTLQSSVQQKNSNNVYARRFSYLTFSYLQTTMYGWRDVLVAARMDWKHERQQYREGEEKETRNNGAENGLEA